MKVPWTEHKTNEEILQMVETERKIMDTVRSRQKRWLGHILRHDLLLKITLEGQIQGKKAYERERERGGEGERENFICHNNAKTNNNTHGKYVAGCQKRLKAHRAGDQKRKKIKNTNIR